MNTEVEITCESEAEAKRIADTLDFCGYRTGVYGVFIVVTLPLSELAKLGGAAMEAKRKAQAKVGV